MLNFNELYWVNIYKINKQCLLCVFGAHACGLFLKILFLFEVIVGYMEKRKANVVFKMMIYYQIILKMKWIFK